AVRAGHGAAAHRRRGERRPHPGAGPRGGGPAAGPARGARRSQGGRPVSDSTPPPAYPATPPPPAPPAPVPPVVEEPRRRLHPLSPLLRGFRYALLAVAAISWQGYRNLGPERWAMAVAGVAVLVLLWSLVSYLVTGYHVVGRELRIHEGLL